MSQYVLDKAYRLASEEGIASARVVVRGTMEGECLPPDGANAGGVLGLTVQKQERPGRHVAIRRLGIALARTDGAVGIGKPVCVADSEGRVKESPRPRFELGDVQDDTAIIVEWLDSLSFSLPVVAGIVVPGGPAGFSWDIQGSQLRLSVTRDGGGVTETPQSLRANIAADPLLSRLIAVHDAPGSDGTGVLSAGTGSCVNPGEFANPIGIAESEATAAGDLIQVFLIPRT